jgi:hypothetical protein
MARTVEQHYFSPGYLFDAPTIQRVTPSTEPFLWSEPEERGRDVPLCQARSAFQFSGGRGEEFGEFHCKLDHAVQIEPPVSVSRKREYFKEPPETFDDFAT